MRPYTSIPVDESSLFLVECVMGCGSTLDFSLPYYVDGNGDIYCPSCRAILALQTESMKRKRKELH